MNEEDIVDLDDPVEFTEPLPVDPLGSDCGTEFLPVAEGLYLTRVQVAPVAPQDHLLVVSNKAVHVAACVSRLGFQFHQEIHGLARVRSPVEEVPGLDEMGPSADPLVVLVDDLRCKESPQELVVVAVDVADCHDAVDPVPRVLSMLLLGENRARGEGELA